MAPTDLVPETDGSAIVLIGRFNPAIVQPLWLAHQKLLRQEEAENVTSLLVSEDATKFETEWCGIQIVPTKFQAAAKDAAHAEALRDLVAGVFDVLQHTPVRALGLNRMMHFKLQSEEEWHRVGDTLAPKQAWSGFVGGRPGLKLLTIQGERPGSSAERLEVTVAPSIRVTPHGIYIQVLEHFEGPEEGASKFVAELRKHWDESQRFAADAAQQVLRLRHGHTDSSR